FLPATDERFVSTVDRIREDLATDHLVHRYKGYDDGLEGREGAFALCSFWLVDALTLTGKLDEAKRLFEKLLKHGNSLGLFSEEIDEESGELLGNFPQSFTHMVLINSALKLDRALREPRERS
ncbi:MAG: glycoside hydrolase family 15 protein, partial [Nitrososphaerales archaeon]